MKEKNEETIRTNTDELLNAIHIAYEVGIHFFELGHYYNAIMIL